MTTLDKKTRIMEVVTDWAGTDNLTASVSYKQIKLLVGLILTEMASMEQEDRMKEQEANVATMPRETD